MGCHDKHRDRYDGPVGQSNGPINVDHYENPANTVPADLDPHRKPETLARNNHNGRLLYRYSLESRGRATHLLRLLGFIVSRTQRARRTYTYSAYLDCPPFRRGPCVME